MPGGCLIKDVVITLGIERRIRIDQIEGFARKFLMVPENFEIVAKINIESLGEGGLSIIPF